MINRNFPGYHWIYWVGPFLGSLLASGFYGILCIVRWERINPGQDFNEWEADNERKQSLVASENTMTNGGSLEQPRRQVPPEEDQV